MSCNRWVLVAVYCGGFVGLGLCIASLGPALLPLAKLAATDVPGMAPVFVARSAGYLLGSLSGPLFDVAWFDGNSLIAVSLIIAGAGAALMPTGSTVGALSALTAMQGVGMGFLDTGGNVLTLQLFRVVDKDDGGGHTPSGAPHMVAIPHGGDGTGAVVSEGAGDGAGSGGVSRDDQASGMALQSLHASFAIGAIIAPLVVGGEGEQWRGGLVGIGVYCALLGLGVMAWRIAAACCASGVPPHEVMPGSPTGEAGTGSEAAAEDKPAERGGAGAGGGGGGDDDDGDDTAVRSCASDWQRWQLVLVTAVLLGLYVGCEAAYGGLLVAYTVGGPQQSEQTGADITAVYWGAIAVGRISGVGLARCLKPRAMMVLAVGISVLSSAGLVAVDALGWPEGSLAEPDAGFVTVLWPLVALLGIGFSVIFPTAIALAESFVPLAGGHATAMVIGAAIGEAAVPPAVAAAFGGDGTGSSLRVTSSALPTAVLVCCCLIVLCLFGELWFGAGAAAALARRKASRKASAAEGSLPELRPVSAAAASRDTELVGASV